MVGKILKGVVGFYVGVYALDGLANNFRELKRDYERESEKLEEGDSLTMRIDMTEAPRNIGNKITTSIQDIIDGCKVIYELTDNKVRARES